MTSSTEFLVFRRFFEKSLEMFWQDERTTEVVIILHNVAIHRRPNPVGLQFVLLHAWCKGYIEEGCLRL